MQTDEFVAAVQEALTALDRAVSAYLDSTARCQAIVRDEQGIQLHLVPPRMTGKITRRVETRPGTHALVLVDHGSRGPVGIEIVDHK